MFGDCSTKKMCRMDVGLIEAFKAYVEKKGKDSEFSAIEFAGDSGRPVSEAMKFFVSGIGRKLFISISSKSREDDVEILLMPNALSLL